MAMKENVRELLGAYLCGDITPEERVAVERILAVDRDAQAEARELKALLGLLSRSARAVSPALVSALRLQVERACAEQACEPEVGEQVSQAFLRFLKQGERPVSEELVSKLAARLSAALPGAGIGREVVTRAPSRREAAQTVRVYVVQRKGWRTRVAWAGVAAAALIALVLGVARLLEHGTRGAPARGTQVHNTTDGNGSETNPTVARQDSSPLAPAAAVQIREKETANAVEHVPVAPQPPAPGEGQDKAVVEKTGHEPKSTPIPPEEAAARAAKENVPGPDVADRAAHQKGQKENATPRQPEPEPALSQKPPRQGGGIEAGGGLAAGVQPGPSQAPPAPTQPVQAPPNMAVVLATRDGNIQALTPDGQTLTLAPNQVVPSGCQIITDQGRVGLRLPGDNRLWVNGGSSLTLNYSGQLASVVLNRGEIAYKTAPEGTGSLAVVATDVEVKDAKYVDMKIEDNAAKVSVLDKQTSVGAKGRPSVKAKSGTRVIVPLTGAGQTRTETITTRPDYWTDDLFPLTPTSNNPRSKNRTQAKRR